MSQIISAVLDGKIPRIVNVDVAVYGQAIPQFILTGSLRASARESRERIQAAFRSVGIRLPRSRVVVSVTPAEVQKQGSSLDLALVAALLSQTQSVQFPSLCAFLGEVNIDGSVTLCDGWFLLYEELLKAGYSVCLPSAAQPILSQLKSVKRTYFLANIKDLLHPLRVQPPSFVTLSSQPMEFPSQQFARFLSPGESVLTALSLILAGGHHTLFFGAPGEGKTYLRTILQSCPALVSPQMQRERLFASALLGEKIGSAAEKYQTVIKLGATAERASLLGLGNQKSALLQGHQGILFLDELPLLSRSLMPGLRQVASGEWPDGLCPPLSFLPRHTVVATANPCACGHLGTVLCRCTTSEISRHQKKFDIPFLDRIACFQRVLVAENWERPSKSLWESWWQKIVMARARQEKRGTQGYPSWAQQYEWEHCADALVFLRAYDSYFSEKKWSRRRILHAARVSITLADLEDQPVTHSQVTRAISLVRQDIGNSAE